MREHKISLGRESVCERHTREQWRKMRPWEIGFVFVCEKEIFKRKSHSFSDLRSARLLCVRGGVRVAHRGIVERNETPGDEVCVCVRERDFTGRIIVRDT